MDKKNILTLFKESLKNKNTYIPNLLTASRLVGAFVIPGLFLSGNIPGAVIATAAFASTDFFDGKIARKYNGYSEFGRILDPIVDKVFAIVPAIAILPNMPLLTLNIGAEAAIAYINSKSYTTNGNPQSSFLGKFKTFCLFPTIGLAYLSTALNIPEISLLANAFSIGTFAVQGMVAKDYHKKAKEENNKTVELAQANGENIEEEKEKQKTEEVQYTQEKEKKQTQNTTISTSQQIASTQEQLPDQWQDIDIDAIVDQVPELIEAPIEEPKPKVLIRKRNNTNRSDE